MLGNWLKTSILMAGIVALFGAVGAMLGGSSGMLIALAIAGAMNIYAYWFSDKMVLKMYNAQEVDAQSAPKFYAMVQELARNAGLPMPKVYVINEDQPNAFATGRNPENAAVAATTGIMRILSERELRGVMAQEPVERVRGLSAWRKAPAARIAHPREEHLIPLMVATGAAGNDRATLAYNGTFGGTRLSAYHFEGQGLRAKD